MAPRVTEEHGELRNEVSSVQRQQEEQELHLRNGHVDFLKKRITEVIWPQVKFLRQGTEFKMNSPIMKKIMEAKDFNGDEAAKKKAYNIYKDELVGLLTAHRNNRTTTARNKFECKWAVARVRPRIVERIVTHTISSTANSGISQGL